MDPAIQIKMLRKSKIDHLQYDPTICNTNWARHFQEIFNHHSYDVNVKEDFIDKLRVRFDKEHDFDSDKHNKIYDPREIKTAADAKAYARTLTAKRLFREFNFNMAIQANPKRKHDKIRKTKEYILNHYHRTFGEKLKSKGQMEPDYIYEFRHVPDVNVKAKLRSIKKHGYNRKAEDEQLKGIIKNIKIQRGDKVQQRLRTFGSLNVEDEPDEALSEAISECPSHIEQEYEKNDRRARKSIMIQSKHARKSEAPSGVSPELLRRQTMMNWMAQIDKKMQGAKAELTETSSSIVDDHHLNLRMLSKTAEPGKRVQFYTQESALEKKREETEVVFEEPDVLLE